MKKILFTTLLIIFSSGLIFFACSSSSNIPNPEIAPKPTNNLTQYMLAAIPANQPNVKNMYLAKDSIKISYQYKEGDNKNMITFYLQNGATDLGISLGNLTSIKNKEGFDLSQASTTVGTITGKVFFKVDGIKYFSPIILTIEK